MSLAGDWDLVGGPMSEALRASDMGGGYQISCPQTNKQAYMQPYVRYGPDKSVHSRLGSGVNKSKFNCRLNR